MEVAVKEQSTASAAAGRQTPRLLRYPLRSASKSKEEKPPVADAASAPRRGRSASTVSKSVGVLELSAKENSAKPRRRLSVPSKSSASPAPRLIGNITPISEARAKRSSSNRGINDTPISDISKLSSRKKFSVLFSASYWLSQIKLSETAGKHSLSLGFFKLALEAGCEPLQRMRDELKSYARKHSLAELGELLKELFENYNISGNFEQLQISKTCSHVPEEGTRSSDEDIYSSSLTEVDQIEPNSSITDAAEIVQVKDLKKEKIQKDTSAPKVRRSAASKNASNLKSPADAHGHNSQKRPQRPKQELNKSKVKGGKKSPIEDFNDVLPVENILEENKENLDSPKLDEISSIEA